MTQAQRKKLLAEAQERLRLADEALKAAQDARTDAWCAVQAAQEDVKRNEPLTGAMKNCLILMYRNDKTLVRSTFSGRRWYICDMGINVRESVFEGLQEREILGNYVMDRAFSCEYPLSDWGKQVAEALAKAEGKG